MPANLLKQCADLGITVKIVQGGLISATPRPPADLLAEMKRRCAEIVTHLCPAYVDDEALAIDTLRCAVAVCNLLPADVLAEHFPRIAELADQVADGADPVELARLLSRLVWENTK